MRTPPVGLSLGTTHGLIRGQIPPSPAAPTPWNSTVEKGLSLPPDSQLPTPPRARLFTDILMSTVMLSTMTKHQTSLIYFRNQPLQIYSRRISQILREIIQNR